MNKDILRASSIFGKIGREAIAREYFKASLKPYADAGFGALLVD